MFRNQYGFSEGFLHGIQQLGHLAAIRTGIFEQPASPVLEAAAAGPHWTMPDGAAALFGGPVFGDGSEKGGHVSWAVVELSDWKLPAVPTRSAAGLLDGLYVQNNGGELQALLSWLQHLDPTCRHHEFYTDSAWVWNGWHGVMVITADTPFFGYGRLCSGPARTCQQL